MTSPSSYSYVMPSPKGTGSANAIDHHFIQDSNGGAIDNALVWELPEETTTVDMFPSIDHGPVPVRRSRRPSTVSTIQPLPPARGRSATSRRSSTRAGRTGSLTTSSAAGSSRAHTSTTRPVGVGRRRWSRTATSSSTGCALRRSRQRTRGGARPDGSRGRAGHAVGEAGRGERDARDLRVEAHRCIRFTHHSRARRRTHRPASVPSTTAFAASPSKRQQPGRRSPTRCPCGC